MAKMVTTRAKSLIPYVGLSDWVERNDLAYWEIAELIGVGKDTVSDGFRGKTDITKSFIDKILDITGMTYEECFEPMELE